MTTPRAGRAIVVGGSIAGLLAAVSLLRAGWAVEVFERSEVALTGRGAGIITQPQLREALAALGIEAGAGIGVDVSRRRTLDREGRIVAQTVKPLVATSWNHLFELLRGAFPAGCYHLGRDLKGLEDVGDRVVARFADGATVEADLLVGADGFRSAVRARYRPDVRPLYAGYVAWRCLLDEADLSPATHRDIADVFAFGLPPEEQILGYPVAGTGNDLRPGRRRYNVVWYRPADADAELPHLLTDRNGHRHAVSIPPPLIAPAVVAEMRAHAQAVFAPQFAEAVQRTHEPFLQPIYDLETPRMAFGRVALVGDAAFVARPHVGAGTAKAAEDAAALARHLAQGTGVPAALAAFGAERSAIGRRIVAQARHLGTYMQRTFRDDAERLRAERHRSPEAVMAETALLDFLAA